MSEDGKRPGGLTALAVLNFVFGGFGALALLALFALLGAAHTVSDGETTKVVGSTMLWFNILLSTITVGLMITAGVGYLGQKRFLGRKIGNAYALCSLASTAIGISITGFQMMSMVGFVYPVLTLFLLNNTFKDDLVN